MQLSICGSLMAKGVEHFLGICWLNKNYFISIFWELASFSDFLTLKRNDTWCVFPQTSVSFQASLWLSGWQGIGKDLDDFWGNRKRGNALCQLNLKSHHAPSPAPGSAGLVGESAENGKWALQVLSLWLSKNIDCAGANVGGGDGGRRDMHHRDRGVRCLALTSLLRSLLVRANPVPVLYRSLSHCCCLWNRLEVSQHGRGRQDGEVWSWWQAVSIRQQLWHLLVSELDSVYEQPQCPLQRKWLNQTATDNTTLVFTSRFLCPRRELRFCYRDHNSGVRGTKYLLGRRKGLCVLFCHGVSSSEDSAGLSSSAVSGIKQS